MPDDTSDYASPTPSTASDEGTIAFWQRRYAEVNDDRAALKADIDSLRDRMTSEIATNQACVQYAENDAATIAGLRMTLALRTAECDEALALAESRRLSVVWFQGREAELIEQVNSRRHALSVAQLERDLARAQLAEVPDNAAVPVEPPALASISTRDARACKRLLQGLRALAEGSADGSEAQLDAVLILLGMDA